MSPNHYYQPYNYYQTNNNHQQQQQLLLQQQIRLGLIQAQHELARNFYDDYEFCPVQCSYEVLEHCERIQQRLSPVSSPSSSPSCSPQSSPTKKKRAIPIINPNNMTPVNVSTKSYYHH